MSLEQLPYELLVQVISNLSIKDVYSFIQCNSYLYQQGTQDSFWHDLCNLNKINYKHPEITWRQLYGSNNLSKMCCHINYSMLDSALLQEKKELLWTSLQQQHINDHVLCLHRSCNYFGVQEGHPVTHDLNKHNLVLRISPLHSLELWCNACTKTIGFNGFDLNIDRGLKSERYMIDKITRSLVSIQDNSLVMEGRRNIEASLYKCQSRYASTHIIEKKWHTQWLDFISGNSDKVPSTLTNETILRSDGSLDPKLSLGKDFELIGSLTRWYIERIYGVSTPIIDSIGLEQVPEYCKLAHSIRIRQQVSQVQSFSRYR